MRQPFDRAIQDAAAMRLIESRPASLRPDRPHKL